MPTPKFKLEASADFRDGDFVCAPLLDGQTPAFPAEIAPPVLLTVPAKPGASRMVYAGAMDETASRLTVKVYRLDARHSTPALEMAKVVSSALQEAEKQEAGRVVVLLDAAHEELIRAAQEGAILGGYVFDTYLSEKKTPLPVALVVAHREKGQKGLLKSDAEIFDCVNIARDLLNEPPNVINPPSLATRMKKLGKAAGLKVTVWDEKKLEQERCGGIVNVGKGADAKPRLVICEYAPAKARKHLALVGKGVTLDSGGYCLKPSDSQVGMKYDMGGAALTFGAACAIARLKLPIKVTAIMPLVENDISGSAYHTTSILTFRNGRTAEVHNTDAEGRLILADALVLAAERKPDWIVDAATLTGACVVALGSDIAAAYGNAPEFTQRLISVGSRVHERFWEMPLHWPYAEQLKTTIADGKNIGSRWGGSITAALFLAQFVDEKTPWIHLDIAGPGIKEEPLDHLGKGAKGFGVKTAVALAAELAEA